MNGVVWGPLVRPWEYGRGYLENRDSVVDSEVQGRVHMGGGIVLVELCWGDTSGPFCSVVGMLSVS